MPSITRWAKPSTMAVLPTPASPSSTGLFFVRRQRIWMARSISFSRPMTGSSFFWRASSVRSRPKLSSAGVLLRLLRPSPLSPPSPPTPPRPPRSRLAAFEAVAEQVENFLADFFQLQAQVHEHLGGDAFLLAQQAEQDVLGADVVVVQVAGLFHRVLDDLLGPRRLRQLAHRDHVGAALDELLDFEADLAQIDVEVLQHVGRHAAAFFDQAQQDVLGADVFVVEALGLLIGQLHHLAGTVGKSFVHFHLRCNRSARLPRVAVSVLIRSNCMRRVKWARYVRASRIVFRPNSLASASQRFAVEQRLATAIRRVTQPSVARRFDAGTAFRAYGKVLRKCSPGIAAPFKAQLAQQLTTYGYDSAALARVLSARRARAV